jgi:hypothetical protein
VYAGGYAGTFTVPCWAGLLSNPAWIWAKSINVTIS